MIKNVLQKGSNVLHVKCTSVKDFKKAKSIVTDLNDTITYLKTTYPFPRGIGLAAPQIGQTEKISVVEGFTGKRFVLINPELIKTSDTKIPIREGCISFFAYRGMVPRYDYVKISAFDEDGKKYHLEGRGSFAMLLQHEMDHLNGIMYIDHLKNGESDLFQVDV